MRVEIKIAAVVVTVMKGPSCDTAVVAGYGLRFLISVSLNNEVNSQLLGAAGACERKNILFVFPS